MLWFNLLTDIQNWFKSNTVTASGTDTTVNVGGANKKGTFTFTYTDISDYKNITSDTYISSSYVETLYHGHGAGNVSYYSQGVYFYIEYNNKYRIKYLYYHTDVVSGRDSLKWNDEVSIFSYAISPSLTPIQTMLDNMNNKGMRSLLTIANEIKALGG